METVGERKIVSLLVDHSWTVNHQDNTAVGNVWSEGVSSQINDMGKHW